LQQKAEKKRRRAEKFEELIATLYELSHWLTTMKNARLFGVFGDDDKIGMSPIAKVQAICSVYFPEFEEQIKQLDIPPRCGCEDQRFDLRFFRPFRADLSIKKSSSFFPPLIASTSQRGLAPRPAHVSPDGPRYLGGTFLPFKALPPPRTATLRPPTKASILANCF
jgi:hypothetical protein